MTSVSKNVYIDKLDDIVRDYNNAYHRTIKMEPVDVKDNTYINSKKDINDKDPKFKIGNHLRISKYNFFVVSKFKNTVPWTSYVSNDLNDEEIIGTFYEKKTTKD